jgi:hypothetical protein
VLPLPTSRTSAACHSMTWYMASSDAILTSLVVALPRWKGKEEAGAPARARLGRRGWLMGACKRRGGHLNRGGACHSGEQGGEERDQQWIR